MTLHNAAQAKDRLSIGPIEYCGYVCLINEDKRPNCQAFRGVIKGILRVIIYTNRNIKKGEEITYNYAKSINNQLI